MGIVPSLFPYPWGCVYTWSTLLKGEVGIYPWGILLSLVLLLKSMGTKSCVHRSSKFQSCLYLQNDGTVIEFYSDKRRLYQ